MALDSAQLYEKARHILPGGVNSPVRAFRAVGGTPRFIAHAAGAYLFDVEGRKLIDYIGSWGPMILGHGHGSVIAALSAQMMQGLSFGAPSALEVEMAEAIIARVPSVEMVRMVNSGTEATMSAIRVARAATGREMLMKFEGCYHGHGDAFLSKAGSGAATLGVPTSPGVPAAAARTTLNARYNDIASVLALFDAHPDAIAAVIVEPIVGNMGCVPPEGRFLHELQDLCRERGALMILDEVMTGFRVSAGGAQQLYGLRPDLTTMGKVIGGGLPVGAYGGRGDIMERIAPAGPVYQAGTLSGNPLGMAAGLAMLRHLGEHPEVYTHLEAMGARLEAGVVEHIKARGYAACYQRVGSMATLFFAPGPIRSWDDAAKCDTARFGRYFHHLLDNGIHMPPAQFEAFFLSAAHTEADIDATVTAMRAALDVAFAD